MQEVSTAFKFDLSSIPHDAEVLEATLELYRIGSVFGDNNTWDNPTTYELKSVNTSWSNAGNTNATTLFDNWTTFATAVEPEIIASAEYTPAEKGWFTFDVLSAVKKMVETPDSNHGFMLFSNGYVKTGNGGSLSKFVSGDGTTAANRPKLTVTYSPATPIAEIVSSQTEQLLLTFENALVEITLFNTSGRQIMQKTLHNKEQLKGIKTSLQTGIYIVSYSTLHTTHKEKWIIH